MNEFKVKTLGYKIERKLIIENGREVYISDNTIVVGAAHYQDDEECDLIDELLFKLGKHVRGLTWFDDVASHQIFMLIDPEDEEDESN